MQNPPFPNFRPQAPRVAMIDCILGLCFVLFLCLFVCLLAPGSPFRGFTCAAAGSNHADTTPRPSLSEPIRMPGMQDCRRTCPSKSSEGTPEHPPPKMKRRSLGQADGRRIAEGF